MIYLNSTYNGNNKKQRNQVSQEADTGEEEVLDLDQEEEGDQTALN